MNNYLKNGSKALWGYLIITFVTLFFSSLLVFTDFIEYWAGMTIYSGMFFISLYFYIYSTFKTIGGKEIQRRYTGKTYKSKGVVYGLIGIIPIVLVYLVAFSFKLETLSLINIRKTILNYLSAPIYFIVRFSGSFVWSYLLAISVVPIISGIGYWAGHTGFYFEQLFKKRDGEKNE